MGSALQSSSMKVVATLTTLCLLAAPALSKNLGSINVKDFGEVFVCAPDWAAGAIQMHDNGFTMGGTPGCTSATVQWTTGILTPTGKLLSTTSISPTPWTSAMLAVTAMLLPTSSTCQETTLVMGITTVMPTSGTTSGAPSTTPWRATSTPSPPPSTPATGVTETGTAVTEEAARSMLSMLTPT